MPRGTCVTVIFSTLFRIHTRGDRETKEGFRGGVGGTNETPSGYPDIFMYRMTLYAGFHLPRTNSLFAMATHQLNQLRDFQL